MNKEVLDILRFSQIRVTRTTEQIFQILQEVHRPVTAEEIYLQLRKKGNASNLSTVYRTIERFIEKGLVHKHAYMADGKSLYELAGKEHHHYFRCLNCGQLWAVDTCPINDFIQELSHKQHLQITGHKLELSGYCEKCQPNKQDK